MYSDNTRIPQNNSSETENEFNSEKRPTFPDGSVPAFRGGAFGRIDPKTGKFTPDNPTQKGQKGQNSPSRGETALPEGQTLTPEDLAFLEEAKRRGMNIKEMEKELRLVREGKPLPNLLKGTSMGGNHDDPTATITAALNGVRLDPTVTNPRDLTSNAAELLDSLHILAAECLKIFDSLGMTDPAGGVAPGSKLPTRGWSQGSLQIRSSLVAIGFLADSIGSALEGNQGPDAKF